MLAAGEFGNLSPELSTENVENWGSRWQAAPIRCGLYGISVDQTGNQVRRAFQAVDRLQTVLESTASAEQ